MPWIKDKATGERKWFPSGGVSRETVRKMIDDAGGVSDEEVKTAVEEALAKAKESGDFKGDPGDDYILTEADKTEIAEQAAELAGTPDVDMSGLVKSVNGNTPDENGNVEIETGSEQVQADWTVNDPADPAYVIGRTHYSTLTLLSESYRGSGYLSLDAPNWDDYPICIEINGIKFTDLMDCYGDGDDSLWADGGGMGFYAKVVSVGIMLYIDPNRYGSYSTAKAKIYKQTVEKKILPEYLPTADRNTLGVVRAEQREDTTGYSECVTDMNGTVYAREYKAAKIYTELSIDNLFEQVDYRGEHGIYTDSIAESIAEEIPLTLPVHAWYISDDYSSTPYKKVFILESADGSTWTMSAAGNGNIYDIEQIASSSSGGGGNMIVTVSVTGEDEDGNPILKADKTFAEVMGALESGVIPVAVINGNIVSFVFSSGDIIVFESSFIYPDGYGFYDCVELYDDNSVSYETAEFQLITGEMLSEFAQETLPSPPTASAEQVLVVSAVDENGRVTETSAMDVSEIAEEAADIVDDALSEVIGDPSGAVPAVPGYMALGMTGAAVGQVARIAAVDADGKPTEWEPVEMAGGGMVLYIGEEEPTNGTLYWLDTSDTENEPETVTYTVTKNLTNVTIDNTAETVAEKSSYAATLTADEGWALSSVTVTMGSVDITSTSYDAGNVYIASVTGDIVITAVAVETAETVLYTITNNLVNVNTSNTAISAEDGTSYTATLTVADGYDLDTVTVTMGGIDVTADVYADGVINIAAVTGDVVVTAVGVVKDMTFDDSNVYKKATKDTGSAELGFGPTTTPTYDEFMSLDVEKLYFCFYPYDTYKKTMKIRGRYTAGWGVEVLAQNITIAQATNGTYPFITNAWDKYSESGYVVFEIDVAAVKVGIQAMYDNGKLDSTKDKHMMIESQLNAAAGSTAYLLYKYNG